MGVDGFLLVFLTDEAILRGWESQNRPKTSFYNLRLRLKYKTELLRLIEIPKLKTNKYLTVVKCMERLIDMISGFAGNGARNFIILKFKNLSPFSIF